MSAPADVLVVNCGSSSVKFSVIDPDGGRQVAHGVAERLGTEEAVLRVEGSGASPSRSSIPLEGADHRQATETIVSELHRSGRLQSVVAVGHRVVHGGESFRESVQINDEVLRAIEALVPLAPLHNPLNLLGIRAALAAVPDRPHVAVFDTAFHQTMPAEAYLYALPRFLYEVHGIRRYGFHGTSHEWVSRQAAERLEATDIGLVTAHLGNGCSATAVQDGRSVDTTMGLTPLEGLVMGTRSGDVDPGMLPMLGRILGRDLDGVERLLNRESGLMGLSGVSNDMRALLDARAEGDEAAGQAIDVFCHRLAKSIGGLATSLRRLDALVFTGGIGEHSPDIRAETLRRLRGLGFELDQTANDDGGVHSRGRITRSDIPSAWVIPTEEERMIAMHAAQLLRTSER